MAGRWDRRDIRSPVEHCLPVRSCVKGVMNVTGLKRVAVAIAAFGLASCAQAPEEVRPAYVSSVAFDSWNCRQLGEEQARLQTALVAASTQQNQTRSNDVAGWLLLGLPVGSMSGGNVAPEIANYKGQIEAVQQAMIRKSCAGRGA
jgi:starvation-inducible outer membrane lipoprotein